MRPKNSQDTASVLKKLKERYTQEVAPEIQNVDRAGLLAYYVDNHANVRYCFMKPSDPAYGGSEWNIPKGRVDGDEAPQMAAIREASEETGLKINNLKLHTLKLANTSTVSIGMEHYRMLVYVAEVIDPLNYGKFHHETSATEWLTALQFQRYGRRSQVAIVDACDRFVKSTTRHA